MEQLSGLDAFFLALDTATNYGHIGGVAILDGTSPLTLQKLTELTRARLHLMPHLTRRLVEVPFGIDQPYWIEDPDFDLEFHVREIALPAPGDDRQLAEQAARLQSRPLDRSRPLWETYLIHGLAGDRQAIYTKTHHAAIDGASGAESMTLMLDTDRKGREIPPAPPRIVEQQPSDLDLLGRALANRAAQQVQAVQLQAKFHEALPEILRALTPLSSLDPAGKPATGSRPYEELVLSAPGGARPPKTPFNGKLSPHRKWTFRKVLLEEVKEVRAAHRTTVNDVVLAMCAGALRRWLFDHDALPDVPLLASVPISTRPKDQTAVGGNQVSDLIAQLPTHLDDPLERLRAVHESMRAAKELHAAIPAALLTDPALFSVPAVTAQAARLARELQLHEHMNPSNLYISNVPGPKGPLYYGGSELLGTYPLSTLAEGLGLNITINGYGDGLGIGLLADRQLVPDLEDLATHLVEELAVLRKINDGAPSSA